MTIGVSETFEVDVQSLISGELSTIKWITKILQDETPESSQSCPAYYLGLLSRIDMLVWQLEQASFKKSVEFETAWRRYTIYLPTIHSNIRDLRLGRQDRRLAKVGEQLEALDLEALQLRQLLESAGISKIRELLKAKKQLLAEVEAIKREIEWLETVGAMEKALDAQDLDAGEMSLGRLDELVETHWKQDSKKTDKVKELRQKLVDIIRDFDE